MTNHASRLLAAALLAALPLSAAAQFKLDLPDLTKPLKDIDPFNKNSKLREGLRDFDDGRRKAGKELSDDFKSLLKKTESWTSEQLFVAYRDHVVAKNRNAKGVTLKPGELHYRMIHPVIGKEIDPKSVTFYFSAYVPADMAAITFDNSVYVRGKHTPDNLYQASLLVHEMMHSVQYARLGGWKGFSHRYAGQIGKSIREGRFTSVSCMHDSLGLEQEAAAREKLLGEYNPLGTAITNQTTHDVHYAMRGHDKGAWKSFTLKPGETRVHSYPMVLGDDILADPSIQFDHDFSPGCQRKSYGLDGDFVIGQRREVRESEAEHYHFSVTKNKKGIDLYTGKGRAPVPPSSQTIDVTFTNATSQEVAFHLNGGKGLDTSLPPGKSSAFKVVVDAGTPPTVAIRQPKGAPLSFSLKDDGVYEFRHEGGQIRNFVKAPARPTPPVAPPASGKASNIR